MAAWRFACKTILGMNLDLKMVGRNDLPLRLTRAVSGSGSTNPTKLMGLTDVIEPVQELQLLDAIEHIDESTVMIPVILRNSDVKKKYDMYQIGIYAEDPDLGEILYIILQSEGAEEIPSGEEMKDFKLEWYINLSVSNADNIEVVINETGVLTVEQGDARYVIKSVYEIDKNQLADGIYKNQKAIADHLADKENPHSVTKVQVGLENADNTSDIDKPVSTAQQAAINTAKQQADSYTDGKIAEVNTALTAHTGNKNNPHKVTKTQIGLGNVNNTSDADKPVSTAQQTALDTLYQQLTGYVGQKIADLINGAPAAMDTLKEVADAIANHKSIMDALNEAIGKKANEAEFDSHTKDTTKHITAAERTKWNDANTKKHTHDNKSVLDGITSTLIDKWNSAVTHITDTVKHITSEERDKWNNGSHNYGTCSTDAATTAKAVACTGFKLAPGAEVTVKFTKTNTAASPTLNVNSTGAKAIYYRGAAVSAGYLAANRTYTFRYNGTQWDLVGDINTDTKYTHPGTAGNKHIPAGGAAGQILRWSADGTAAWGNDNDTQYTPASAAPKADGTAAVGTSAKYAREDHVHPTDTSRAAADHTHTAAEIGAAAASHGTHVTYGTGNPKANGTAAPGTATTVSRSDHVHPSQTSVSGNAGTATKLATARTVDGVAFDGSAAIGHYGTCSTAAATAAKTVALTGFTLVAGAEVCVKFTVTNTATNPTLNVNGTGAKAIFYRGAAVSAGYLAAKRIYRFVYDGTNYELIGDVNTNTTYGNMKGATADASGAAGLAPAPGAGAQGKYLRGDGTWQTPPNTTYGNMTAATANAAGKAGLCPAPAAGAQNKVLKGNAAWDSIENLTNAFSQATSRANLASGETLKVSLGKIMKWFADLTNGAASTLLGSNLTANRALVSNSSGKVGVSAVTSTELGYLDGVTSNVQEQLDALNTGMPFVSNFKKQKNLTNTKNYTAESDCMVYIQCSTNGVAYKSITIKVNGTYVYQFQNPSSLEDLFFGTMVALKKGDTLEAEGAGLKNSNFFVMHN